MYLGQQMDEDLLFVNSYLMGGGALSQVNERILTMSILETDQHTRNGIAY